MKTLLIIINLLPGLYAAAQFEIRGIVHSSSNTPVLFLHRIESPTLTKVIDSIHIREGIPFSKSVKNVADGELMKLSWSDKEELEMFPEDAYIFAINSNEVLQIKIDDTRPLYRPMLIKASPQNLVITAELQEKLEPYFQYTQMQKTNEYSNEEIFSKISGFQVSYMDRLKSLLTQSQPSEVLTAALYYLKNFESGAREDSSNRNFLNSLYKTILPNLPKTTFVISLSKGLVLQDRNINLEDLKEIQIHSSQDKNPLPIKNFLTTEIVVIDFWASWCGPCRTANKTEIPGLLAAYRNNKNVSFLSVSIDTKVEKWKDAVKEDKITWKHYKTFYGSEAPPIPGFLNGNGVPCYIIISGKETFVFHTSSLPELKKKLNDIL